MRGKYAAQRASDEIYEGKKSEAERRHLWGSSLVQGLQGVSCNTGRMHST